MSTGTLLYYIKAAIELHNKQIESKVDFLAIAPIYYTDCQILGCYKLHASTNREQFIELKVKFSQVALQSQNNFLLVASQNIYALFSWWPSVEIRASKTKITAILI